MKTSTRRILTTHVGSLARPKELLDGLKTKFSGEPYDEAELMRLVTSATAEIVRLQAEAGVDIVSDGEVSKSGFNSYVRSRLSGLEPVAPGAPSSQARFGMSRETDAFPEYYAWYNRSREQRDAIERTPPLVCRGPITYAGRSEVERDIENLRAALKGVSVEEAFVPAMSPRSPARNEYYQTEEEYLHALADAMREEYLAIADSGFVLQVDDPAFATEFGYSTADEPERRKKAEQEVELLNYALRGIPEDRVRFHTCYSINIGPRVHDAPLASFVDLMLRINAGAYSYEAGNPRHFHEWRVWENVKLPEGKVLIPGMVSHTTNLVEHPEFIADLLVNHARLVGRERVIAGADCGFSSLAVYAPEIHPTVVWAKFQALAEGARIASLRLFLAPA